jgi:5-methyltetrahydrofolate corrinoid/iron sulfur protein methyltransferase
MLIIGERINSTRKLISEAIARRDASFIIDEALTQVAAGADYLDVNAGHMPDEQDSLKWLVEVVQGATETPICLDSASPEVIRKVIPLVDKTPIINSVTLESVRLEPLLSIVGSKKVKFIGLCQSSDKLASTREAKLELAGRLVEEGCKFNVPLDDLYIDPLVFPIATDSSSALSTLDAIREIMESFPGVHTICGMTNVSYGLPARKLVNKTFLTMAMLCKLDSVIIDPTDKEIYAAIKAGNALLNQDEFCLEFIEAYREGRLPGSR